MVKLFSGGITFEERVRSTDVCMLRVAISWPRRTKERCLAEIDVTPKSPLPEGYLVYYIKNGQKVMT